MKLQVKTATGSTFLLELSIFDYWKVRNTSLSYVKNVILGRAVMKPELEKPLIILLEKDDIFQSSIVVEIKEL